MRRIRFAMLLVLAVLASTANAQPPDIDQATMAAAVEKARSDPEAGQAYAYIVSMENLAIETASPSSSALIANIRTYLSAEDASPFLTELGKRAARDQFWRKANVREIYKASGGVAEEGLQAFSFLVGQRRMQVDQDNSAWLKAELDRRQSWPALSELSE